MLVSGIMKRTLESELPTKYPPEAGFCEGMIEDSGMGEVEEPGTVMNWVLVT